ncbi:MAG TPA: LysR family transcriptional regulator [Gammaproteobacteria bacterium]|nr:LysR family transcriptional regulator [Gammaproteobacteria bacterium]
MSSVNFNLLKALDSLLSEQHVSKAGERVGITQSAMSIALGQLRIIYKDELLVRGAQGRMELTEFAKNLSVPVREAIRHIETVFVAHKPFEPSTSNRTFHIGMSDYIAFVILPRLMRRLARLAPDIKIVQHAVNHMDGLKTIEDHGLDVVMGDFKSVPQSLKTISLFTDKGVIVADKKHPAFHRGALTTKMLTEYPQVFVALESQPEENFIAEMLKKMGHSIKISLITPHTLIALQTLPGTTLMTNTVERLAKPFLEPLGLAMHETPYKLRHYHAQLYWHARNQNDQGHKWLRELIKEIARVL